jgi:hypothetical protein
MKLTGGEIEGLKARWERAKKGLWAQMYEIKRCPQGGYWVIKEGEECKVYRVTFDTPLGECTCPDWRSRGLPCKHVFMVVIACRKEPLDVWLRKIEEYEPQAQPKPKPEPVEIDRAWVWGEE